jgi:hypothetical protein
MAKFQKGVSGNPAGRPKGVANQASIRAIIGADLPEIISTLRDLALGGDVAASRLLLERCVPALKSTDAHVSLPLTGNPGEDARTITQAAGRGEISPGTAQQLMGAVASQARVLEAAELLARIEALEARAHGDPSPAPTA